MSVALELKGVQKRYGRIRALDGLDLTVPAGSIFGLVGSNGAGKTTAMAVSLGLLHRDGGEVSLFGEGPFVADRHAGRVSLLPQDSRFPPHARVGDLLRFYGRLQGVADEVLGRSIDELLDWVHLQERRQSPVKTLSHGMNRRLAIAQAFLGAPDLVLLDEPLNGLDPVEAARVREMIRQRRGRQAVVISSHNLSDIEALFDTVAFIEKGRLVRQDALEVITQRCHRVVYTLAPGVAVSLLSLTRSLPGVEFVASADGMQIAATFPATHTVPQVNAQVLHALLADGVGILEIRRGSDLETEYLRMHAIPPPPLPDIATE